MLKSTRRVVDMYGMNSDRWLPQLQAKTLAVMWLSGSILLLAVGELSSSIHMEPSVVGVVALTALAVPILLTWDWKKLPPWCYHALIITAAVLLGASVVHWKGTPGSIGAGLLFVWLSLYVFFFFSDLAALCHLATFEAVIAGALFASGGSGDGAEITLLASTVAGSGLVTGFLTHSLKSVARIDPLTGLGNRAALEEVLTREIARAERGELPLCVAFLDLDDFKLVNDYKGHASGDELLVGVVSDWQRALRATDVMARLGGDEFALVLPDLSRQDAPAVLDRARQRCRHGCSLGVSIWHPGDTVTSMLNRADAYLYAAKKDGKNQVAVEGIRKNWVNPMKADLINPPFENVVETGIKVPSEFLLSHHLK